MLHRFGKMVKDTRQGMVNLCGYDADYVILWIYLISYDRNV